MIHKLSRFSRRSSVIGVEVGERFISAVQLEQFGFGAAQLAGALRVERASEGAALTEAEVASFATALRRAGFSPAPLALAAPDNAVLTAQVELPPRSSRAPLEKLARIEVARLHRRDAESFEMAMWDLPAPDRLKNMTFAMTVAIPTSSAMEAVAPFTAAGLEVIALDARACALARVGLAGVPGFAGGLLAIVEIGWSGVSLALVHAGSEGCVLVYERRVEDLSFRALVRTVQERLGLDALAAEHALRMEDDSDNERTMIELHRAVRRYKTDFLAALAPELQRSLFYAMQRYPSLPLLKLLITGDGANVRGIRTRLANALGVEAATLLPKDVVSCAEGSTCSRDAGLCAALGLALHERAHQALAREVAA